MLSLLILTLLGLATSQSNPNDSAHRNLRNSDPVSSFFSELGDLILDVDQTIAVQTRPKIEHESNVMTELFRPRSDYFNRIQNNYKEIQKRLGKLIGNTIGFRSSYSDHELSTVSPPPENFVPTIGPDFNPFTVAAEARKEKLKQKISKQSVEPRSFIPQTIDESLKAFSKLSQAIVDNIENFSERPPKSVGEKDSSKRSGNIGFKDECDNEILEDPDLEQRRQDRCSRIAAEKRARESLRKLVKEPKRVTEVLFSTNADSLDKLSMGFLGRSGNAWTKDSQTSSINLEEECGNEILQDPDLEKRRQEKCSQIAAEEQLRADLKKLMRDPKQTTEALFSKTTDALDKISKDLLDRSGDSFVENLDSSVENNSEMKTLDETSTECSGEALEDAYLENLRKRKCARIAAEERLLKDLNELFNISPENEKHVNLHSMSIDDILSSVFLKRSGDSENENSISSDSLDKRIRQLIKDHGSWILDYPILKRWRQRDRSTDSDSSSELGSEQEETVDSLNKIEIEPTELYLPVSTDYEITVQNSEDAVSIDPLKSSFYKVANQNGNVMEEEFDFVLDPESLSDDIEVVEPKETVILAFTSDGVPLKLRLGPEIDNPIQYLHKALQSASVSLNIPVESYDDLEPVGKEVLKLGSGILTRAALIDASNSNELKILLKALMVSKSTGKTVF